MRGLESQSLHVIDLRSGDPHLISWQRPLKRSDAGSGRGPAPPAGELSHSIFRFENASVKPVFGHGHVFARRITWFAAAPFAKS